MTGMGKGERYTLKFSCTTSSQFAPACYAAKGYVCAYAGEVGEGVAGGGGEALGDAGGLGFS